MKRFLCKNVEDFHLFDDMKKKNGDNPAVGILLCTETEKTVARYSAVKTLKKEHAAKRHR
jgi:hypothetical protein